jgi:hypothetical protein
MLLKKQSAVSMGHKETGRILIVTAGGGEGHVVVCVNDMRSERRVEQVIDRVQSLGSQSFRCPDVDLSEPHLAFSLNSLLSMSRDHGQLRVGRLPTLELDFESGRCGSVPPMNFDLPIQAMDCAGSSQLAPMIKT